jgi:hypothetical protein
MYNISTVKEKMCGTLIKHQVIQPAFGLDLLGHCLTLVLDYSLLHNW